MKKNQLILGLIVGLLFHIIMYFADSNLLQAGLLQLLFHEIAFLFYGPMIWATAFTFIVLIGLLFSKFKGFSIGVLSTGAAPLVAYGILQAFVIWVYRTY